MKRLGLLVVFSIISVMVLSCDLCSHYLAINPAYNKNMVSIRYRVSQFEGEHVHQNSSHDDGHSHSHDLSNMQGTKAESQELYQTYELLSRWYLTSKLQLIVSLPYGLNTELLNGAEEKQFSGFKDVFFLSRLQLLDASFDEENNSAIRLFAGAGIKLPTGNYKKGVADGYQPTFQTGTGSVDVLTSATLLAKKGQYRLNTDVVYTINSSNSLYYRFANRLNITSALYYSLEKEAVTIMPSVGFFGEFADQDIYEMEKQHNTGGNVSFASVALDVYLGNFAFNGTIQLPVYEHLYGKQAENKNRYMASIAYVF